MPKNTEKATFAGGCFWGIEKIFGELEGVLSTRVGYVGGVTPNPTYEAVCTGLTGHAEAIELIFDPNQVTYDELLEFFFTHHDATTLNRQGNDIGTQYRSAIFYHSPKQKESALRAIGLITESGILKKPIVTQVVAATEFYPAEKYHQKYLEKNPGGYCHIQLQSPKISEILRKNSIKK